MDDLNKVPYLPNYVYFENLVTDRESRVTQEPYWEISPVLDPTRRLTRNGIGLLLSCVTRETVRDNVRLRVFSVSLSKPLNWVDPVGSTFPNHKFLGNVKYDRLCVYPSNCEGRSPYTPKVGKV